MDVRREGGVIQRAEGATVNRCAAAFEQLDRQQWVDSGGSGLPKEAGGGGRNRTLAVRSSRD